MSGQTYEYCAKCGDPTGKAGAGDGSIYWLDGHVGPLCDSCDDQLREQILDDSGEITSLRARVEELENANSRSLLIQNRELEREIDSLKSGLESERSRRRLADSYHDVAENENAELRARVEKLERELASCREVRRENDHLEREAEVQSRRADEACDERDAALARLALVEPVVEAAERWVDAEMREDFRALLDQLEHAIVKMREGRVLRTAQAEEVK